MPVELLLLVSSFVILSCSFSLRSRECHEGRLHVALSDSASLSCGWVLGGASLLPSRDLADSSPQHPRRFLLQFGHQLEHLRPTRIQPFLVPLRSEILRDRSGDNRGKLSLATSLAPSAFQPDLAYRGHSTVPLRLSLLSYFWIS